jgi:hypothetical protein
LTRAIIDFLNLSGWQAERINSTGRVMAEPFVLAGGLQRERTIYRSKWIPGTGCKGTADISATIRGFSVKIEVKKGDRQSEAQKRYQKATEAAGGQYWLVRSFADFLQRYDEFIVNNKSFQTCH